MKIELTKKQYKTLLTIMYCGEWILNCHKTSEDKISIQSNELEQIIFSHAKDAILDDWIEYDEDMKTYFPTADMEDAIHKFIDLYNLRQKRQ